MTDPSVVHSTFQIERIYPVSPARVFAAFTDTAAKRRWFAEGEGWEISSYGQDFRIGGEETSRFRFGEGPEITYDAVFMDIVKDQRIVHAYRMSVAGAPLSASLGTTELVAVEGGTLMTYTEQGVFLDGADSTKNREEGSRELLEKLAEELARA